MRFTQWKQWKLFERFKRGPVGQAVGGAKRPSSRFDLAQELKSLHEGLSEEIDSMEHVFVGVGDWFGEVIRDTMSYSKGQEKEFNELTQLFSDDFRVKLRMQIGQIDELIQNSAEVVSSGLVTISDIASLMASLKSNCQYATRDLTLLRTSAVGLKVESVSSQECMEVFSGFPAQVEGVIESIAGEMHIMVDHAGQVHTELNNAGGELERVAHELHTTRNDKSEINKDLPDNVNALSQQVSNLIHFGERRAREISNSASKGIYYLQFGDIVRQKCEHILEVLASALKFAREQRGKELPFHALKEALTVQCRQLESLEDEIQEANRQMVSILRALESSVNKATDAQADDVFVLFERITTDLQGVSCRLKSFVEVTGTIDDFIHRTEEQVKFMGQHRGDIWNINERLWLLAMNATMKASRLESEGHVIKTLADEICSYQETTERNIRWLDETLSKIEKKAQSLTQMEQDHAVATDSDVVHMSDLVQKLNGLSKSLQHGQSESNVTCSMLQSKLDAEHDKLQSMQQLSRSLSAFRSRMEKVLKYVADKADRAPQDTGNVPADFTFLSTDRYTMESEREVHGNDQISDDDSVDLFDDLEDTPPAEVEPVGSLSKKETNSAKPDPDLGDNVDLF